MKKITLLFLLAILPMVGFAQIFDFTNTDDGWNALNSFTSANGATFMTLTTVPGDGTLKNPTVKNATTGADASTNAFVGVTIRNNDANGPTFLRISYPKPDGGRRNIEQDITAGDTDFVTYWFDMTHAEWTGTMDDIKIHFKNAGNTDYILPNTSVTIDIDKIEFASSVPTTENNVYNFDSSDEGWNDTTRCTVAAVGGDLEVTLTGGTSNSKVALTGFYINATNNAFAHITLKNNTNDDQLKLVYTSGTGSKTKTMAITTMDATYMTYDFDLGADTEWTGNVEDIKLTFDDTATQEGSGVFLIDKIVFDNDAILSVNKNELTNFTLYPNPVNSRLNFNSLTDISKIEIYNLMGQRLLQYKNFSTNSFDISTLSSGVYLINVEDVENKSITKKIIVSK